MRKGLVAQKIRADLLLVQRSLASSREKAQALILSGQVYSGEIPVRKSGQVLEGDALLEVRNPLPYVSRGGLKLEGALDHFGISPENKVCLDIGCSTGGFTDCLLKRGARRVYAVDVGRGQFDWKLRQDARVVLLERTNFRTIEPEKIPEKIALAVADVSFISLEHILPRMKEFLTDGASVLVMVKPQFELSPSEVKKGVVRSENLREKAVQKIRDRADREGFRVEGVCPAKIQGPKGNQEYFLYLHWNGRCASMPS